MASDGASHGPAVARAVERFHDTQCGTLPRADKPALGITNAVLRNVGTPCGWKVGSEGLFAGLVLRALVDDLAVVHMQLPRVHGVSTRNGLHMQVGDPMEVGQRKGKAFSLFRRDKVIDIYRMNRLITMLIATTVAQGFIASGEAG